MLTRLFKLIFKLIDIQIAQVWGNTQIQVCIKVTDLAVWKDMGERMTITIIENRTKTPNINQFELKVKLYSWFVWIEDLLSHKTIMSKMLTD